MPTQSLADLRIIDLTRVLAGPYATMILADLGAEVIKVELPGTGDEARQFGPFQNGVSAYFMSINRGKKSITLNLRSDEGKEILKDLVRDADILTENYRPGAMKRLGLDYEVLKEINPGLIYAATSGFGQTGPLSPLGAYDMIIQAMGGLISITGEPGRPPVRVGTSIGDLSSALFTVIGILSALHHRERTGEGQFVDIAMLDCQAALLENAVARYAVTGEIPQPLGSRHPSITPFQIFKSKDGYLVLAIGNDATWKKFCDHVGRPDLVTDLRFATNPGRTDNQPELELILNGIFQKKNTIDWLDSLESVGIPSGPIQNVEQVIQHPQIQAREMMIEVTHPVAGPTLMPASPIKLSETPARVERPSPGLGEHNESVLRELLGMSEERIAALKKSGVL
ncbi:MAG: CaiB/BaiF CoA-transferase family protein [Planctomycetota bacterium]|nr:CaiB/BaiF CoA-transferase family protein [Planctomycetota bacterium]MDA1139863.1 CaiB/BaiF CoA-transferase family protein [Planctomycetota bacterium]